MLDFPSLGVWGAQLVWGGWAPAWGIGPAGLLVRALGKYLDPAGNGDRYGPQNPAHGGTKTSGTILVACQRKGSRVTCGPVQDVLAQGILDKIHHWGSVVGS